MSNITQKVLIDLETKKAREEMKKLAASSGDTKEAFAKLEARAKELEKSIDGIKNAAGTGAPNFKALGNVITAFNQGLEIGGKAIRFAEEGLEAYAKTSAEAAGEVRVLTSEFTRWKNTVMEGVGELTVALGKSLPSVTHMEEVVKRMDQTGKSLHDAAADVAREIKGAGSILDAAFGGLNKIDYAGIADGIGDKIAGAYKKAADQSKKASVEAARWRAEMAALGNRFIASESRSARAIREGAQSRAEFQAGVDADVEQMYRDEAVRDSRAPNFGAAMDSLSESGTALAAMKETLRELQQGQEQTLFESIFGPVSEIDLYKQSLEALGGTLTAFTDAVGAGYKAIVTGSQPIGQAMKAAAAASILATGTASAVDAARETALGFGSLAWGPIGGVAAAAHFKSAALHAAVAVGAGVAANALGAGANAGAAGGGYGGSAAGGAAAQPGDQGNPNNQRATPSAPIYVILGEHFGEMSARERRARVDEQVARAIRERDE